MIRNTIVLTVAILAAIPALASSGSAGVCTRHIVRPEYSPVAWAAQMTGEVHLLVSLDSNGSVQQVEGTGSFPLLVQEAKGNVSLWRFCKRKNSREERVELVYEYRLEGAPTYKRKRAKVKFDLKRGRVVITLAPGLPEP